jgi:magnesium-transporting ATPase (P-type)
MGVLARPTGAAENVLFCKGAAESVIDRCDFVLLPNGTRANSVLCGKTVYNASALDSFASGGRGEAIDRHRCRETRCDSRARASQRQSACWRTPCRTVPLPAKLKKVYLAQAEAMACDALRVLALAKKTTGLGALAAFDGGNPRPEKGPSEDGAHGAESGAVAFGNR